MYVVSSGINSQTPLTPGFAKCQQPHKFERKQLSHHLPLFHLSLLRTRVRSYGAFVKAMTITFITPVDIAEISQLNDFFEFCQVRQTTAYMSTSMIPYPFNNSTQTFLC